MFLIISMTNLPRSSNLHTIKKYLPKLFKLKLQPQKCLFNSNYPRYSFGFFKDSWRNKEYAITEQIKRTTTSEQLLSIIKTKGSMMNIVHLTAILDRMEEQQMINTNEIVNFAITNIKLYEQIFRKTKPQWIRTICNIICYLGNIKNVELNYLFILVDYKVVLAKSKNIEKVMLITGLVRLGIFSYVFGTKSNKTVTSKIYLQDIISENFQLNQILSIWFAIVNAPELSNIRINQYFQQVINSGRYKFAGILTLKQYNYAFLCYIKAYDCLKFKRSGKLYQIVSQHIPIQTKDIKYLMPYELSLLLDAISKLKSYQDKQQQTQINFYNRFKNNKFKNLINNNFIAICHKKNTTFRNISNIYKQMYEIFGVYQTTVLQVIKRLKQILQQQIIYINKTKQYYFDFKVDSLSLCSLTWKINQYYSNHQHLQDQILYFQQFNHKVANYLSVIQNIHKLDQFTTHQLLMLYSGFYYMCKNYRLQFSNEFKDILANKLMNQKRSLTLKEITLFYTYLKRIQVRNKHFCCFIKNKVDKYCSQGGTKNEVALKIHQNDGCLMNLQDNCLNCFPQLRPHRQARDYRRESK